MSENKKALQDWFDSHVIVSGLDKKANKKIKESLKAELAKDLEKEVEPKTKIIKFNADWYNFKNIDQTQNYVTISNLRFSTDIKAINQAKRINPSLEYAVVNQIESEVKK